MGKRQKVKTEEGKDRRRHLFGLRPGNKPSHLLEGSTRALVARYARAGLNHPPRVKTLGQALRGLLVEWGVIGG